MEPEEFSHFVFFVFPKRDGRKSVMNCWKLSQNVLWHVMTIYDILCQWKKEDGNCHKMSQIVVECHKLSQIVVTFPSRRPHSQERNSRTSTGSPENFGGNITGTIDFASFARTSYAPRGPEKIEKMNALQPGPVRSFDFPVNVPQKGYAKGGRSLSSVSVTCW